MQLHLFINLKLFKIMAHCIYCYPCTADGRILKGFCVTKTDSIGFAQTLYGWHKFSSKFNITHYAFRSNTDDLYKIFPLV